MPQAQTQPAKHPKFTALLVDYISEHKDKIIERWIKAVQAESEIKSSESLTHKQLADFMPTILEDISCLLRQQSDHICITRSSSFVLN